MSGYEGQFLGTAHRIGDSFAGMARSFLRLATAMERIAAAMEEINKREERQCNSVRSVEDYRTDL